MIVIYTGNGKGKTSACVGQAIRALGNDLNVYFAQFMKSDQEAGEQKLLKTLLNDKFFIGGAGFFLNESERPKHRQAALNVIDFFNKTEQNADIYILDECLYALDAKLISQAELLEIIEKCKNKHLILSGRNMPKWLEEIAHTVSEIMEVKHSYQQGISATKGIEF